MAIELLSPSPLSGAPPLARLGRPDEDRGRGRTGHSRTPCGPTPATDPIRAGQRRATDESACTPGSVHGCLAASRWAVIHLGLPLPAGSSGLPAGIGRAALERLRRTSADRRPFLTLLRVGFTEPHRSPGVRWSLTPPFHPYQCAHWRSVLCGTVPRVTPGRCWRPPCPVEPGRSSATGSPPPTRPPSRLVRRDDQCRGLRLPRARPPDHWLGWGSSGQSTCGLTPT
jgi:hypothetical protein